jgi:Tfp pilus assembly major pilin PilA
MEKKCTKCGVVKSLDEFTNDKKGKHGKRNECKICTKEWSKKYIENNKEKESLRNRNYYKKNIEKRKTYLKKWRENNKEKIHLNDKIYRNKNKEKIKERKKEWTDKNRKKINKYKNLRKQKDPLLRLRSNISASIIGSLRSKGYTKKNNTHIILKCKFDFFIDWLNNVASNGYTYGVDNLHLDHVIPISLAQTEDEILLLCHYSNYQLLTADENQSKGNRYVNRLNLARVLEHHPEPNKIKEIYSRL